MAKVKTLAIFVCLKYNEAKSHFPITRFYPSGYCIRFFEDVWQE
jgi:hypothetical protein